MLCGKLKTEDLYNRQVFWQFISEWFGAYEDIGKVSDKLFDVTFEQIKKQLNRFVEVIKVIDLTTMETHTKELLFIKVKNCSAEDKQDIFQMAQVFEMDVVIGRKSVLLQCVHTEKRVDRLMEIFSKQYPNNIIVVRSGAVAIGSINITER